MWSKLVEKIYMDVKPILCYSFIHSFESSDNNIDSGSDYEESLNSKQKWKWRSKER